MKGLYSVDQGQGPQLPAPALGTHPRSTRISWPNEFAELDKHNFFAGRDLEHRRFAYRRVCERGRAKPSRSKCVMDGERPSSFLPLWASPGGLRGNDPLLERGTGLDRCVPVLEPHHVPHPAAGGRVPRTARSGDLTAPMIILTRMILPPRFCFSHRDHSLLREAVSSSTCRQAKVVVTSPIA